jgi:hypothetical protein
MVSRSSVHLKACFEPDQPAASAFRAIGLYRAKKTTLTRDPSHPARTHRVSSAISCQSTRRSIRSFPYGCCSPSLGEHGFRGCCCCVMALCSDRRVAKRAGIRVCALPHRLGSSAVAGVGSHWHGAHWVGWPGGRSRVGLPVGTLPGSRPARARPRARLPRPRGCLPVARPGRRGRPAQPPGASWWPPSPPAALAGGPTLTNPTRKSCRLCRAAGRLGSSGISDGPGPQTAQSKSVTVGGRLRQSVFFADEQPPPDRTGIVRQEAG